MTDRISFILPTLNEEKNIAILLQILIRQLEKDDEIIVVDSYSQDRTAQIAEKYGAKVILRPKEGIGAARMEGSKIAANELLVFLDCDCVVSDDYVKRLRSHFENKKLIGVCGMGLYRSQSRVWGFMYNIYARIVFYTAIVIHKITKKYWFASNNCAFRTEPYFKAGGYRAVVCEDTDLMKRMPPSEDVIYDSKLLLWLSDRRLRENGFFRTLWLWGMSNFSVMIGKAKDSQQYSKEKYKED
ncbi:glycosyltransferase family 2 protein [Candidatus Micrarchaeota archaeon]|nr:glycosyltransferase family 2 protein [Candidatus Micrarchaeota archaeon]